MSLHVIPIMSRSPSLYRNQLSLRLSNGVNTKHNLQIVHASTKLNNANIVRVALRRSTFHCGRIGCPATPTAIHNP